MLGRVYAYQYDPKHKSTLPFYDENPLVIPFAFKRKFEKSRMAPLPPSLFATMLILLN